VPCRGYREFHERQFADLFSDDLRVCERAVDYQEMAEIALEARTMRALRIRLLEVVEQDERGRWRRIDWDEIHPAFERIELPLRRRRTESGKTIGPWEWNPMSKLAVVACRRRVALAAPRQDRSDRCGVPSAQVDRWTRDCRRLGLLAPSSPGKPRRGSSTFAAGPIL
jgi:hypothetical protein